MEAFFELVRSRAEDTVEEWLQGLRCPVMRIDGTRPVEENADRIIEQICGQVHARSGKGGVQDEGQMQH